jgi:hypothetical protein
VRTHDDQVAVAFFRDAKDLRKGLSFLQAMFDRNPGIRRLHCAQLVRDRFMDTTRARTNHRVLWGDQGQLLHVQDDYPAVVVSGKRTGQVKRMLGLRREVCRVEDSRDSEHRCLLMPFHISLLS